MLGGPTRVLQAIGGFAPPIVLWAALLGAAAGMGCERRPVGKTGEDPGPVVARVNGQPLYRHDLDAYLPDETRGELTAEERKARFEQWVSTQLLYEEAQRSGLQMSRDIDWKLEQYRKDLVADRLVQEVLKERAIVSRDEALAYYRAHRDEFNLEVRVSHILATNLEDAEKARELLKTRPFSRVAREMSADRHTGAGGDLGYLSKGNMPAEFEKVVFGMRVGQVSDIIESEFGYHILKLTDIRAAASELPFETVAPEIARELLLRKREAVYDSLLSSLTARASIEVLDPDLRYAIEMAESLQAAGRTRTGGGATPFTQAVPEPAERQPAPSAPDTAHSEPDTARGE
jgi:hypothetical protein